MWSAVIVEEGGGLGLVVPSGRVNGVMREAKIIGEAPTAGGAPLQLPHMHAQQQKGGTHLIQGSADRPIELGNRRVTGRMLADRGSLLLKRKTAPSTAACCGSTDLAA